MLKAMRWQNICYKKLKWRFQTPGTLALLVETISCIYFMASDSRFAEPIKQVPSGWVVLACSLEDRISDMGQKSRGRLVTRLWTSSPTSMLLGKASPPHPTHSVALGTSRWLWGCFSLWDQEEPEAKLTRALLLDGPLAHPLEAQLTGLQGAPVLAMGLQKAATGRLRNLNACGIKYLRKVVLMAGFL